jgi:hypothetical protein
MPRSRCFASSACAPVTADARCAPQRVPFYELHGEKRVAAGLYDEVIRYHEHIAPLADALRSHVERSA